MTKQIDLFTKTTAADQKFAEFDRDNPAVYRQLVSMTKQLLHKGHKRVGMQMLIEVIRWRTMIRTTDPDFKINNNYASRYARKIMAEYPELDGIFETRELKT